MRCPLCDNDHRTNESSKCCDVGRLWWHIKKLQDEGRAAVEAEREACARIADKLQRHCEPECADIARDIRARSAAQPAPAKKPKPAKAKWTPCGDCDNCLQGDERRCAYGSAAAAKEEPALEAWALLEEALDCLKKDMDIIAAEYIRRALEALRYSTRVITDADVEELSRLLGKDMTGRIPMRAALNAIGDLKRQLGEALEVSTEVPPRA